MKQNVIRTWFSILALMLMGVVNSVWAQSITINDFFIEAGATKQPITIDLVKGNMPVLGFQCDVELPAGLTIAGKPTAVSGTMTDEYGDATAPTVSYANNRLVVYSADGLVFNDDATALVTLRIDAAADFAGGDIKLTNIVLSCEGNVKVETDDVAAKVATNNIVVSTPPSLAINDFFIEAGATKQPITIDLVKGNMPVLGFQCDVELPAGLTLAGKPTAVSGTMTDEYGDATAPTVSYANNRLVVYSADGLVFNDDATALVTLRIDAAADFAGGDIKLTNIVLSCEGNVKVETDDVAAKVTTNEQVAPVAPKLYISNVEIQTGNEAEIVISLEQGSLPLWGFQADLDLPYGLTVASKPVAVEGTLTDEYGDPATPVVSYANGRLVVYNSDNYAFSANAKEVVTIRLKASTDFVTSKFGLQNVVFSCENNVKMEGTACYAVAEAIVVSYTHDFEYDEYLLYNVGAGRFLVAGNYWGTMASLLEHPDYVRLLPQDGNNVYYIETTSSNGGEQYYLGAEAYMDQDPIAVTINQLSNGYYTLYSDELGYIGYDGQSTVIGTWLSADSDDAQWTIVSVADAKAAMAQATTPVDATFLIRDHNFSRNNRDRGYWEVFNASNYNLCGGDNTNCCAESWRSTFNICQTIEDLPAGWYALTAQGFWSAYGTDDFAPVFYANDAQTLVPLKAYDELSMTAASQSFSEGLYTIEPIYTYVEEGGTLTIGVMLENNTNGWCCFDNFTLTYLADAEIDIPQVPATLALEGLSAEAGTYVTVPIRLEQGTIPVKGFEADLTLPAGMTVQGWDYADGVLNNNAWGYEVTPIIGYDWETGHLSVTNDQNVTYKIGAKTIVYLYVHISSDCEGGDIRLSNISLTDKDDKEYKQDDVYAWVSTNYIAPTGLTITHDFMTLDVEDATHYDYVTLGHTTEVYGYHEYGALQTSGNGYLEITDFSTYYDPNIEWEQRYSNDRHSAVLLNNTSMSAENVSTELWITDGVWTFLSFPYDVRVSDITPMDSTTEWVIRRYDGAARAQGYMDATWVTMGANDILYANQGYIWQSAYKVGFSGFIVPALSTNNKQNIFAYDEQYVELKGYDSEFAHNRSWNLVGNPYPTYYDMRYMDFTAPVTTWNVNTQSYEAYMPGDDNYVFFPGEAFFVQRPDDSDYILFDNTGRQSDRYIYYRNSAPARTVDAQRTVINLTLSDGTFSDRTRVVLNESALSSYELDKDASKFMSASSLAPQLYSVADGVNYAINERPIADGTVELGAQLVKAGSYTIALSSGSAAVVTLEDRATGALVLLNAVEGYTFTAEAGTLAGRFVLYINNSTGIGGVNQNSGEGAIYDISGRRVQNTNAAGVYIENGKKVVVK